jgi:hypothetical protein
MPWAQTGELDVYDNRGRRFTLYWFTRTDEKGVVIAKECRMASTLVAKQISDVEFQYPGVKKFKLQTIRPAK